MPPRKRKNDVKQPSLEEVVEEPVKTKKSKKGDLANPEIKSDSTSAEALAKRKLARKHQGDPAFAEEKTDDANKPDQKNKQEEADEDGGQKKTETDNKAENTEVKSEERTEPPAINSDEPIVINRAPTLTLWVAAVAQRQGYSRDSGLTFGKAISGILAQSKGRSIGIYEKKDAENTEAKQEQSEEDTKAGIERIEVFGMTIKAVKKDGQFFATESGSSDPMDPKKCNAYLQRAFKERLKDAEEAFKALAASYKEDDIGEQAYHLYEQFRPQIASGKQGWGKKGELNLKGLQELHSK